MNTFRHLVLTLFVVLLPSLSFAQDSKTVSPININTADVQTLSDALKGVGPAKARAIIAYRDSYGGFKSIDELIEVKGIGAVLIDANRDRITLE